jgi:hypothetical protein
VQPTTEIIGLFAGLSVLQTGRRSHSAKLSSAFIEQSGETLKDIRGLSRSERAFFDSVVAKRCIACRVGFEPVLVVAISRCVRGAKRPKRAKLAQANRAGEGRVGLLAAVGVPFQLLTSLALSTAAPSKPVSSDNKR